MSAEITQQITGFNSPKAERIWRRCRLRYVFRILPFIIFLQSVVVPLSLSYDRPFNNAANWGGTGLMEIPNARILEDGVIRFGVAQALPYRWFTGAMGILPGLEASGRVTQITNISSGLGSDYGSNKDKAFDLKYQILPESKWFPALAFGLHDFHGTKLFEAQYIVFSRQLFPFDFTVGLGRGRLGDPDESLSFLDEIGLFGGIEWTLNERVQLMAEYNPIEYEKDKPSVRGVPEGAEYPVNIGMRIKVLPGIEVGVSCQRGDTLGMEVNVNAALGKPIVPHRADPPPQVSVDRRPFRERDTGKMVDLIHDAIHEAGFKNVSVYTDGKELTAEFTNEKYLSHQKATGRVLRILLFHAPSDTGKLTAIAKRRGIPLLRVSVNPDHFEKYLFGEISEDIFPKLIEVETATDDYGKSKDTIGTGEEERFSLSYGIKPDIETYLNDPSGFFKGRVGIKPQATASLWKGAEAFGQYDIPFYSNISSSNEPPPDAVRSDSWKYSGRDYSFERLMLDQTIRISNRTFGRVSTGYFERMYAGIGGEVLRFFGDGRLALGLEADWVRKREPETQFSLMDFDRHTLLGNMYYHFKDLNATLHTRYGRYLAGDVGWLFDVSRQYDTGAVVGFWYSFTDTDDLSGFNKDYNEKGIYLSLPARMFLPYDSSQMYRYSIAPWSRDVAATVYHWQTLFDFAKDLMPGAFRNRMENIKD